MEEFANLSWRISEASVLDVGTNFITEETIAESYVFLDNFIPITPDPVNGSEPGNKPKQKPCTNAPKIKLNKNLQYMQHSFLNHSQHKQCLEALQLLESDRPLSSLTSAEQQLINMYNNLKNIIIKENAEFLNFVEQKWNQRFHSRTRLGIKKLNDFIMKKRLLKFELIKNYPKFYADNSMIPLLKNQNHIEMIHEGSLLELGVVAKLHVPNTSANFHFNPKQTWMVPSLDQNSDDILATAQFSVSNDIHAEYLAKQTACNVVISSSSLKTIIDNFGPDFGASWDIPIVVKEHIVNGKKFNVVYIDKTLPQRIMTSDEQNLSNNYISRKILMKRYLGKEIAHSFETPNVILENFNAQKNIINEFSSPKSETNDKSADTIECSTPETPENNLTELTSPKTNAKSTKTIEFTPKKQKMNPIINTPSILTRSATRKLNGTISSLETTDESNESTDLVKQLTEGKETETKDGDEQMPNTKQKPTGKINKKFIKHDNVNYRLWKLKSQNEENILIKNCPKPKEIKLLVRSKTDTFQVESGKFLPTNLVPKLEYQSDYGATMLTKSELLRQWTMLYFRPFSNLLRVRISPHNNRYMKFENVNLNKITCECMKHYNFNPKDNLGVLFNVLSNMVDLTPGNYILRHEPKHGTFAALLKSVSENSTNSLDLHDLYKDSGYDLYKNAVSIENDTPSKWIPIDTTFIFPYHSELGLMPGLFPPQNFEILKKKKKKKKNKFVKKTNTTKRKSE